MKSTYLVNLVIFLLGCFIAVPKVSAQAASIDSLKKIMFNSATLPEQRKKARDEMFRIQRERDSNTYQEISQQSRLLVDSKFWIEDVNAQQNFIVDQVINLVSKDSVANDLEKKEAIRLLARSRNPKAYSLLMDNIWYLSTTDDYNNTDYWFVKQEPAGNWVLFPEIIRLISTKKLEFDEGMVTVTLLLDKIVQDPPLLIAILNLYAQKEQNEIFFENKKNIVQLLQDMH